MGGGEAARNTVQPSMRRIVPCCASPHRRDAPRRVSPVPQTGSSDLTRATFSCCGLLWPEIVDFPGMLGSSDIRWG